MTTAEARAAAADLQAAIGSPVGNAELRRAAFVAASAISALAARVDELEQPAEEASTA